MTRHRSPRGRGARQDERRSGPPTAPFAIDGPVTARHRSPVRSALRHGAVAAGITGGALALVAPPTLQLAAEDARGELALSADATSLDTATTPAPTPAVTPVTGTRASGAASADLIKASDRVQKQAAAGKAAVARQAAAKQAAATSAERAPAAPAPKKAAGTDCGVSHGYGGVADSVQEVGNALECVFPGHDVLGVGSRGNASDHPGGYALDVMTTSGDAIADCMIDNKDALGVSYVIWDQRINTGSGWEGMEDRGGATANHEDHVHISFDKGGSPDTSALKGCG